MALVRKRLLHADATLHKHIEDLLLRVEFRGLPHLARDGRKLRRLFRKSARRKHHAQRHLVGVARRNVRIREESHRTQVLAHEYIQLSGGALCRVELVEQHAQHRDIGHVVKRHVVGVEIQVQVVDVAAGQLVAQARQRARRIEHGGWVGLRRANIGSAQARQRSQSLGRIGRFLHGAQLGHIVANSLLGRLIETRKLLGELALFLAVVLGLDGLHFEQSLVVRLHNERLQHVFEIAAVKPLAHMGERVFVAQVRGRERIVVEPAGKRVHREHYAIGHAAVTFAQLKR